MSLDNEFVTKENPEHQFNTDCQELSSFQENTDLRPFAFEKKFLDLREKQLTFCHHSPKISIVRKPRSFCMQMKKTIEKADKLAERYSIAIKTPWFSLSLFERC